MNQGHTATEVLPPDPQPLGGAVIPPKRAWRLATTNVANLSIEADKEGRYWLVVEYNDGHRLEHDVTEPIKEAVAREVEQPFADAVLKQRVLELEERLRWSQAGAEEVREANLQWATRCEKLEQEVEFAKGWIRQLTGQNG